MLVKECEERFVYTADKKHDVHIKISMSCEYGTEIDGENMTTEYFLNVSDDEYRPFGISAVLRNSNGDVIEDGGEKRCFATLDEAMNVMRMFALEDVMPCTISDLLV